ncbi:MAG: hypothetical protein ACXW4M_09135 [Anaerolineales bacterium]
MSLTTGDTKLAVHPGEIPVCAQLGLSVGLTAEDRHDEWVW